MRLCDPLAFDISHNFEKKGPLQTVLLGDLLGFLEVGEVAGEGVFEQVEDIQIAEVDSVYFSK